MWLCGGRTLPCAFTSTLNLQQQALLQRLIVPCAKAFVSLQMGVSKYADMSKCGVSKYAICSSVIGATKPRFVFAAIFSEF